MHASFRQRLAASTLSILLVALLIAALLQLGASRRPGRHERTTAFTMLPEAEKVAPTPRRARAAAAQPKPHAAPPPTASPPPPPQVAAQWPGLILSRQDFAATDIGKMASAPSAASGADEGDSEVAEGGGPGGERLYKAEWYREPKPNALALYLPGGSQPGWALIACRTIENYHVDSCRELDESPRGAGLSRALRQAAWQFLVRPPRLGGKPLVGAWVSIRFDFTAQGARD